MDIGSVLFFFSGRRRHRRLQGDWSSDVCSSDLEWLVARPDAFERAAVVVTGGAEGRHHRRDAGRNDWRTAASVEAGPGCGGEVRECRETLLPLVYGGGESKRSRGVQGSQHGAGRWCGRLTAPCP